jgi:hypothetical protein
MRLALQRGFRSEQVKNLIARARATARVLAISHDERVLEDLLRDLEILEMRFTEKGECE